jgi:hypothetical protein
MDGKVYVAFDLREGANQWNAGNFVGLKSIDLANGAAKQWTLPIRNVFASYPLRWRITHDGVYALSGSVLGPAGQHAFYSRRCPTDVLPLLEPGWEKPGADPLRVRRAERCCKGNSALEILKRAPFYDLIPTGKDTCAIYASGDETLNVFEGHAMELPPGGGLITTKGAKRFPLVIAEPFWAVPAGDALFLVTDSGQIDLIRTKASADTFFLLKDSGDLDAFRVKMSRRDFLRPAREPSETLARARTLLIDSDTGRGYAFCGDHFFELVDPPRRVPIELPATEPHDGGEFAEQLRCAKALVRAGIVKLPAAGTAAKPK